MAKFLKSFFNTSEKRKLPRYEGEYEEGDDPPLDGRRKLSISRSGRLKQANRKRHSLTLDLYGENNHNMQTIDKPKSVEYHVHGPMTAPAELANDRNHRRRSADGKISQPDLVSVKQKRNSTDNKHRKISADARSTDDEIDSAFEIIDKS